MLNEDYKEPAQFEVLDDYRVIVHFAGEDKLRMRHIYHTGEEGILCDDFETYIPFATAERVTFVEDEKND